MAAARLNGQGIITFGVPVTDPIAFQMADTDWFLGVG
jgi:hypothetical protein